MRGSANSFVPGRQGTALSLRLSKASRIAARSSLLYRFSGYFLDVERACNKVESTVCSVLEAASMLDINV